jgi:hypothetical protein
MAFLSILDISQIDVFEPFAYCEFGLRHPLPANQCPSFVQLKKPCFHPVQKTQAERPDRDAAFGALPDRARPMRQSVYILHV